MLSNILYTLWTGSSSLTSLIPSDKVTIGPDLDSSSKLPCITFSIGQAKSSTYGTGDICVENVTAQVLIQSSDYQEAMSIASAAVTCYQNSTAVTTADETVHRIDARCLGEDFSPDDDCWTITLELVLLVEKSATP